MRDIRRIGVALAALGLVACGRDRYARLRERASVEMSCAGDELAIESIGAGGVRVEGCGQIATYTCLPGGLCQPATFASAPTAASPPRADADEVRAAEPDAPPPAWRHESGGGPGSWTDGAIEILADGVRSRVLACFPGARSSFTVRVEIAVDGTISGSRVLESSATSDQQRCVTALFASVRLDGTASRPRVVVLGYPPDAPATAAAPATGEPPAPDGATSPDSRPTAADPADAVRASLDAHAAAILACVDDDAVGLAVAWDTTGAVTISLRGARAGTPEEECVRASTRSLRIDPAPTAAGSVIHAVTN